MAYKIDPFILNGIRALSPALYCLNESSKKDYDLYVKAYCSAIKSLSFLKKIFISSDLYNKNTENGHFLKYQILKSKIKNIDSQDYKVLNLKYTSPANNAFQEEPANEEESSDSTEKSSDSTEKSFFEFDESNTHNHKSCECLIATSELIRCELISHIKGCFYVKVVPLMKKKPIFLMSLIFWRIALKKL